MILESLYYTNPMASFNPNSFNEISLESQSREEKAASTIDTSRADISRSGSTLSLCNKLENHSLRIDSNSSPIKPSLSYATLIYSAIKSTANQQMTLNNIYNHISSNHPYYQTAGIGWKNSIRHNLSLSKLFVRVPRPLDQPGKGSFWALGNGRNIDLHTKRSRNNRAASDPQPYRARSPTLYPEPLTASAALGDNSRDLLESEEHIAHISSFDQQLALSPILANNVHFDHMQASNNAEIERLIAADYHSQQTSFPQPLALSNIQSNHPRFSFDSPNFAYTPSRAPIYYTDPMNRIREEDGLMMHLDLPEYIAAPYNPHTLYPIYHADSVGLQEFTARNEYDSAQQVQEQLLRYLPHFGDISLQIGDPPITNSTNRPQRSVSMGQASLTTNVDWTTDRFMINRVG